MDNEWLDSKTDHVWHVWLNKYNADKRGAGFDKFVHSMYEFKDVLHFLKYGHETIRKALDGKLRQTHQQCSYQPTEQLPEPNVLKCALGVNVVECPILADLRATFESEMNRMLPSGLDTYYASITQDQIDHVQAATCAWHLFTEALKQPLDLSEGYLMDSSDRLYWSRVYESLAMTDEEPEDAK